MSLWCSAWSQSIYETDILIFNTVWIQPASCKMSNKFLLCSLTSLFYKCLKTNSLVYALCRSAVTKGQWFLEQWICLHAVSSYCYLEQSSNVCMLANLSKSWFIFFFFWHRFVRKPDEFIHPNSTKTCGVPLARAVGELQSSAPFPRASCMAGGLTFLRTGPGTKTKMLHFSCDDWPTERPPCPHRAAASPDGKRRGGGWCSAAQILSCSPKS